MDRGKNGTTTKKKHVAKPKQKKHHRGQKHNKEGRYYYTDEEDYVYHPLQRYKKTSFSLFSNLSDDEIAKTYKPSKQCDKITRPKSTPTQHISSRTSECTGISYSKENSDLITQLTVSEVFLFQNLPTDCKLKIFSYLSNVQKGIALGVCREWNVLVSMPTLWRCVSLWDFPMTCIPSAEHTPNSTCYACYKDRVHWFTDFLIKINPVLKTLEFKFDIGEFDDGYLPMIQKILENLKIYDLRYAHINWKETPCRPFWLETLKWSRCDEVVWRHRHRSRLFVNYFDEFTKLTSKLKTLILPFDWSSRSVECLTRLKNLHSLVVEKYFVFQSLKQELLDELLSGLPNLKRFMLEVWTPSGHGLILFSMVSKSVEYLDVSQSRGFYLEALDMPNLKRFRMARHPWNGPLVCADRLSIPCLYDVLVNGTPKLTKLNDHYLEAEWRTLPSQKLEEVLKSVCSCRRHKTGWAM